MLEFTGTKTHFKIKVRELEWNEGGQTDGFIYSTKEGTARGSNHMLLNQFLTFVLLCNGLKHVNIISWLLDIEHSIS